MPTIRLGDADRARLNAPEWLDVPETLPIRDAKALEAAGGEYMDFFRRATAVGFQTTVWIALRRAGVEVTLDALEDLDLRAIDIADSAPGKAPSGSGSATTPPTSARPSTSRRRTSKTST
jgi:hypothetical protein